MDHTLHALNRCTPIQNASRKLPDRPPSLLRQSTARPPPITYTVASELASGAGGWASKRAGKALASILLPGPTFRIRSPAHPSSLGSNKGRPPIQSAVLLRRFQIAQKETETTVFLCLVTRVRDARGGWEPTSLL